MAELDQQTIMHGLQFNAGEAYLQASGISFFSPKLAARYLIESGKQENKTLWLSDELSELNSIVQQGRSAIIEGGLGSGKSTLLYGLRALAKRRGEPYYYINGHYLKTDAADIDRKLQRAMKQGAIIFWDSLDYLLADSRHIRKTTKLEHKNRTLRLLNSLVSYIDSGGVVVGTSHTDSWIQKYTDADLAQGLWQKLRTRMTPHLVRGVFTTGREQQQFFESYDYSEAESQYLTNLAFGENGEEMLLRICRNQVDATTVIQSLRTYRITKLMRFDHRDITLHLRKSLQQMLENIIPEESFLSELVNYVLYINEETKMKGGE